MVTFHIDLPQILAFLAILLRFSLLFFLLPVFRGAKMPPQFKVLAVTAMTIAFYPLLKNTVAPLSMEPGKLGGLVAGELIFASLRPTHCPSGTCRALSRPWSMRAFPATGTGSTGTA